MPNATAPQILIPGPTISGGQSLSNSIAANPTQSPPTILTLLAIITPQGWTDAPITFQWSLDNSKFYDVYNRSGAESSFVFTPNCIIPVAAAWDPYVFPYIRIRSGGRISPIVQTADRVFSLLVG